ncbi:MAG: hypothetical protein WA810_16125 [Maribacter sp.]
MFDFYLDASIHVALAIIALVQVTAMTLNIRVPQALNIFIFFGSISCYNFVKYGVEAEKYLLVANRHQKNIQFFSLGCLIVALIQLVQLSETVVFALFILGAITALYALPVLPKEKNFRSLGGLKILIVAAVWAGTTVILPVLSNTLDLHATIWIETLQRFFMVLVLLVPFEIRDLKFDSIELHTLPQRFGIPETKGIALLWIVLFLVPSFFVVNVFAGVFWSKVVVSALLVVVILRTTKNQGRYFSSFWVEAIPIVWLGLMLFFDRIL